MIRSSLFVSALLAGVCALPCIAAAQSAPPAAAPAAEGAELQEVIVTAQHRAETAQHAALPISVLQSEALATVTSPSQLTKSVPSAQISTAGGSSPLIYIRGVGTFSLNPYTDTGVAVNYDGVYIGRAIATSGFFHDLDRVEVLKGPQGALYGRNATGGALNIIPQRPKLGSNSGDIMIDGGNYDSYNVQGAVNVAIGDKAALRLSGNAYGHSGYNTDDTYNARGDGLRAQLRIEPTDSFSDRFSVDYSHTGGSGASPVLYGADNPTGAFSPLSFGPNIGMYDPRSQAVLNSDLAHVATAGAPLGAYSIRPNRSNDFYGLMNEATADLGFGVLTVIAGARFTNTHELSLPADFLVRQQDNDRQYSLESRLAGSIGRLDWLGGLYIYDERVRSDYAIDENVIALRQTLNEGIQSYAAFGRLTYKVTDALRLTGAIRYTQDNKSFDGLATTAIGLCVQPTGCPAFRRFPGIPADFSGQLGSIGFVQLDPSNPSSIYIDAQGGSGAIWARSFIPLNTTTKADKATYRAAVEYDLRPENMLYASYETGFRSGGFSFSTIKPTYAPETITAYTVGSKNRFFSDRLQVNVEGFLWKYRNQQIAHQAIGATGGIEFPTENIGSSTNKGFEIDIVGKPLRDTLLNADVQYLDAQNGNFVYQEPGVTSSMCPHTVVSGVSTVDCSGLRALYSPTWTVNLGAQQSFHPTDDLKLTFEVDSHYQSSQIIMFERRGGSVEPAYWLVDLSVSLASQKDDWSLTGYVQNVGDARRANVATYNSLSGLTTAIFGPPRTYGARLQKHF